MSGPILVFGAAGQIGCELMALATARAIPIVGVTRAQADITDSEAVARVVTKTAPRLIVNAAAYTAVDRAESEPAIAMAVNAQAAAAIARHAARADVPILHLSTDYVFDGTKTGAYTEDDRIAPVGEYGRSKAEGETLIRVAAPRHIILRTAWVFGRHGGNFLKTMLRLARDRDVLRVVADQRGCPTATIDIAAAVLAVDAALARDRTIAGTFHFAGPDTTSWHEFAAAIVAAQAETTGRRPRVEPIATADYPTPARRPANSELDSRLFERTFGLRAAAWRPRMHEAVQALLTPEPAAIPLPPDEPAFPTEKARSRS